LRFFGLFLEKRFVGVFEILVQRNGQKRDKNKTEGGGGGGGRKKMVCFGVFERPFGISHGKVTGHKNAISTHLPHFQWLSARYKPLSVAASSSFFCALC
jgi:hypothetical protein